MKAKRKTGKSAQQLVDKILARSEGDRQDAVFEITNHLCEAAENYLNNPSSISEAEILHLADNALHINAVKKAYANSPVFKKLIRETIDWCADDLVKRIKTSADYVREENEWKHREQSVEAFMRSLDKDQKQIIKDGKLKVVSK